MANRGRREEHRDARSERGDSRTNGQLRVRRFELHELLAYRDPRSRRFRDHSRVLISSPFPFPRFFSRTPLWRSFIRFCNSYARSSRYVEAEDVRTTFYRPWGIFVVLGFLREMLRRKKVRRQKVWSTRCAFFVKTNALVSIGMLVSTIVRRYPGSSSVLHGEKISRSDESVKNRRSVNEVLARRNLRWLYDGRCFKRPRSSGWVRGRRKASSDPRGKLTKREKICLIEILDGLARRFITLV